MITLDRWYQDDVTLGRLKIEGFQCFTLELPWLGNKKNISCVPEGRYEYFLRQSSKNGTVLELKNVKDRTNIQIHSANFTRQIKGCIAVGSGIKWLDDDTIPDVTSSKATLSKLLIEAGEFGFIDIRG